MFEKFQILRENLFGGQREILSSNIAKELKVDSVGGYLYWSTGFSVESSKLNGKDQKSYYSTDFFSGKKGVVCKLYLSKFILKLPQFKY